MLGVTVAIAYLYLSAGVRLFSAWDESKRDSAQVRGLERQNPCTRSSTRRSQAPAPYRLRRGASA